MIRLLGPRQREHAKAEIDRAPDGWVVRITEPTRSRAQNDRMWAMLTDLSEQKAGGIVATPDLWKAIVMGECGFECQFMQGPSGRVFPVGYRTSKMKVAEMSMLIEWMLAFGAETSVVWSEPMDERAA
jgi:hypothetical protein